MDFGLINALLTVVYPAVLKTAVDQTVKNASDFVEEAKSEPGDPGYWDPSGVLDPDWWEANVPGLSDTAKAAQNATYWADYKRNTGKKPRYPALQMNGAYLQNLNPSQWAHEMDWWK